MDVYMNSGGLSVGLAPNPLSGKGLLPAGQLLLSKASSCTTPALKKVTLKLFSQSQAGLQNQM